MRIFAANPSAATQFEEAFAGVYQATERAAGHRPAFPRSDDIEDRMETRDSIGTSILSLIETRGKMSRQEIMRKFPDCSQYIVRGAIDKLVYNQRLGAILVRRLRTNYYCAPEFTHIVAESVGGEVITSKPRRH